MRPSREPCGAEVAGTVADVGALSQALTAAPVTAIRAKSRTFFIELFSMTALRLSHPDAQYPCANVSVARGVRITASPFSVSERCRSR